MNRFIKIIWMCMMIGLSCGFISAQENLVQNPGMEQGSDGKPTGWTLTSFTGKTVEWGQDLTRSHSGSSSVVLYAPASDDARLIQDILVLPDTLYRVSGWIRAENVGADQTGAALSLVNHMLGSKSINGSNNDWELVEYFFKTDVDTSNIRIGLSIGGYSSMNFGKAWFDDIMVEKLDKAPQNANVYEIINPERKKKAQANPMSLFTNGKAPSVAGIVAIAFCLIVLIVVVIIFINRKMKVNIFEKIAVVNKLPPFLAREEGIKAVLYSPYVRLFFVSLLVFFFMQDILKTIDQDRPNGWENHYILQAVSILQGRIDIPNYMQDLAVFNGKNYNIYPPFPLLVFLPFVAIWGTAVKTSLICFIFAILSGIAFYRLMSNVGVAKNRIPWLIAAFYGGTAFWFSMMRSSGVCFTAHIMSVATLIFALSEAFGKGRAGLAGLYLGMSFLSRQLTIFFAVFLIVILWDRYAKEELKKRLFKIGQFCICLGIAVIIYFWYNWLRFGSIFDTGYNYLKLFDFLADRVNKHGLFSIAFIPYNFFYTFLQGPTFTFNGITPSGMDLFGTSLTFASPFVFIALFAKWKKNLLIGAWISISLVLIGTLMYYNNGWVQINCSRFTLDFLPGLMILVGIRANQIPGKYWKPLIVLAIVLNVIALTWA